MVSTEPGVRGRRRRSGRVPAGGRRVASHVGSDIPTRSTQASRQKWTAPAPPMLTVPVAQTIQSVKIKMFVCLLACLLVCVCVGVWVCVCVHVHVHVRARVGV